jgi:hypothetical protein
MTIFQIIIANFIAVAAIAADLPLRMNIRMRYYGILAGKNKEIDLNKAKEYFGMERWLKQDHKWEDIALEKLNSIPNQ